jgi:hypothetical protein
MRSRRFSRQPDNHTCCIAEAEKLLHDFGRELPGELTAYVMSSHTRARARQRLVAAAAVFFFALAIAATGAGVMAYRAQQQAVAERDRATQQQKIAEAATERAEKALLQVEDGRRKMGIMVDINKAVTDTLGAVSQFPRSRCADVE